ncbi:MAG: ATP-binding protein [Bacteroidales bacterium]|jgi:predicted AAA+ superfamily ATPase|nr:ATP-binding protein [Bacteroidales bacterium]
MFERSELQILKKRVNEPRKFIQVLMGPRQVGKTTLVSQLLKQINIPFLFESADAIPAGDSSWLQQIWESARLKMKTQNVPQFLLVVDEIQKIANWSETVKKLWDEDSYQDIKLKVILLGSSRLLLQQGLTESLAGRFETIYLTHWTLNEMEQAFDWDANTFAWFGGYPGGAGLIKDEIRWKKYVKDSLIETSISKDILMLTRVDKPALMKNLFELGCLYSGQILSFTKIQGQLQDAGNTTTLSHYLKLLDTAGLLGGIEKFAATAIRKRSSSPKFQVHNNALLNAQQGDILSDAILKPDKWGRVVESAIGAHLLNHSIREDFSVFYWRERNEEVDFVLEKQAKVIAIEVKTNYAKKKTGMNAFNRKFNPHKMILIDNNSLPWHEFLKINPVELF